MKQEKIGAIVSTEITAASLLDSMRYRLGLGDLLAWLFRTIGIAWIVKRWSKATGKACGCKPRRCGVNEKLNRATERLMKWLAR